VFDNQERYNPDEEYIKLVDTTKFIGWPKHGFVEWAYGTPHGPGGHPLEQGHKQIAEKIYEACNNTR
jgi:hypothetical protein